MVLDQQAGKVAEVAVKKLHALMYRTADIHVVNDNGQHVGYIEDLIFVRQENKFASPHKRARNLCLTILITGLPH